MSQFCPKLAADMRPLLAERGPMRSNEEYRNASADSLAEAIKYFDEAEAASE